MHTSDLLAGLNDAQKAAVTHDAGPLVVLAGPGTGKTRVIVHRIAHAIAARAIAPEHILAVTFTVKAAEEMRGRLAELLTGTVADRLNVHTYHGLGVRITERFPDLLNLRPNRQIVDSSQRRQLIRDLISQHRLLGASAGLGLDALADIAHAHFEKFWNHHLSSRQIIEFATERLKPLLAIPRQERKNEHIAGIARLERLVDVARLATLFDEACRIRGWMSYGDLISLPIKLIESHPTAAAIVRDQYRCIVVDEFQDGNASQLAMLRALAPPPSGRQAGPDLCVVGDDDQSIYEFRGADDRAFAKFAAIYPGHRTVALTENYRSQQPIIEVSNHIIAKATKRFDPDKVIERPHADRDKPVLPGTAVQAVKLQSEADFPDVIASLLLTARATEPERPWDDYAVIARGGADLDKIASALVVEGIPFSRRRDGAILDDPGVQDVLAWIRLLTDPTAACHARRILMRSPTPVPGDLLTTWERAYGRAAAHHKTGDPGQSDPGSYADFLAANLAPSPSQHGTIDPSVAHPGDLPDQLPFDAVDDDSASPFLGDDESVTTTSDDAIPRPGSRTTLRPIDHPAVTRFLGIHSELRSLAASARADEVILRIITLADIAHSHLLSGTDRAERVSALATVLTFARTRQARLRQPGDLAAFVEYYDDLTEKDQGFVERESGIDSAEEPAEHVLGAVNLLTAHSSKGLEFDTVFVARVNYNGFPGGHKAERIEGLPDGLVDRAGDDRSPEELHRAGERRLFYVACTRAERRLVLVGKFNKTQSKGETLNFMDELVRSPDAPRCIEALEVDDVIKMAKAASVGPLSRSAIDIAAGDLRALQTRRDIFAKARSDVRLEAALALDSADRPGLTTDAIDFAQSALARSAAKLAAIASIERAGVPPVWAASTSQELDNYCAAIQKALDAKSVTAAPQKLRALSAPLKLSYSTISAWHSCAACFYVKRVLGVPEPASAQIGAGAAVHRALDVFFKRFTEADNNGTPLPTLADLLALGDEEYFAKSAETGTPPSPAEKAQIRAHLTTAFNDLHKPTDHVIEHELEVEFPYESAGRVHTMKAKIDRVDDLGAGRYRIVDYKTGQNYKKFLEPDADDLQMGIYLMALRHHLKDPDLTGTAEYWLLATGERGEIDLGALDLKKIRKKIDQAVAGMLEGNWPRSKTRDGPHSTCSGLCDLLGL